VRISPIISMTGRHHFNEVHLDGVFIPDDRLLGDVGSGWLLVTSELAYKRSGPERWLLMFLLMRAWALGADAGVDVGLCATVGRLRALHQMSLAVAGTLQAGAGADLSAAMVKVLGTRFEGDIAERAHLAIRPGDRRGYAEAIDLALLQRPGFTLRGDTNEILRGVIARRLRMR
jgi:acyl-CoA dehydrogenase